MYNGLDTKWMTISIDGINENALPVITKKYYSSKKMIMTNHLLRSFSGMFFAIIDLKIGIVAAMNIPAKLDK